MNSGFLAGIGMAYQLCLGIQEWREEPGKQPVLRRCITTKQACKPVRHGETAMHRPQGMSNCVTVAVFRNEYKLDHCSHLLTAHLLQQHSLTHLLTACLCIQMWHLLCAEDVRYSDDTCPTGACSCIGQFSKPDAPVDAGLARVFVQYVLQRDLHGTIWGCVLTLGQARMQGNLQ